MTLQKPFPFRELRKGARSDKASASGQRSPEAIASGAGIGDGASPQNQEGGWAVRFNRFVYIGAASSRLRQCRAFRLLLVILQRRYFHQGAFRVGSVDGFAIVPQSLLGEEFGHPRDFGAFGPCVAVAVQRNAGDAELAATLPKLRRPVPGPNGG